MKKTGQAGLEYLVTYGWALILVATAIGGLVFVFGSPQDLTTFSSSDPSKILVQSSNYTGGKARIELQNITGGEIKLVSLSSDEYYDCIVNGEYLPAEGITISAGGRISVECSAEGIETGQLQVDYVDQVGIAKSATVSGNIRQLMPATVIDKCPYTITQPGVYVLKASLMASERAPGYWQTDCITVNTNNATINCQGNTITCTDPVYKGAGVIATGRSGITVSNCEFKDFTGGVYLINSQNNLVTGNTATGNQYGTFLTGGSGNKIRGNNCLQNAGACIGLTSTTGNSISHNTGTGNGNGITLMNGANNNTVTYNTMLNGNTGIYNYLSTGNIISYNIACGNSPSSGDIRCCQPTSAFTGTGNTATAIIKNPQNPYGTTCKACTFTNTTACQ
jgi:parallel beta-helix repeat protein